MEIVTEIRWKGKFDLFFKKTSKLKKLPTKWVGLPPPYYATVSVNIELNSNHQTTTIPTWYLCLKSIKKCHPSKFLSRTKLQITNHLTKELFVSAKEIKFSSKKKFSDLQTDNETTTKHSCVWVGVSHSWHFNVISFIHSIHWRA